ncbi:LuxR C-terminal-related transcriptional regulator [Streptomyces sp. NPDC056069]|uniref:LuxR C-terminal-related transcriptional regulator n=1 Tax=Streptomyces sp. NPDC056069 TaxID=3345702 RepID=UPI0035DC7DF3
MSVVGDVKKWPFVGRRKEADAFLKAWADRRAYGFVVYGPAGVGKSRLAEECLAQAVRTGFHGVRVAANAGARAVPLGAVAHLIPDGVNLSDPVHGFAAVAETLTGGPRKRRWAVWVDDLHLLDAASAVLLRQLMDAGVIRLIATVRDGAPVSDAVIALCHGDAVRRIDLAEFGQEETDQLLRNVLGGSVDRRTLQYFYQRSGGNLLYLHEMLIGAIASKSLTCDGEVWEFTADSSQGTPRLTELVRTRLASADPSSGPALELLSLCEPLPLADAEAVAPLEDLASLEQSGLIKIEMNRQRITLEFTHPMFGDVVRESIPQGRQQSILLQQAERTEARGLKRRDDLLHIATWRLAATGTADPGQLMQAAILAHHAHDYPQTVLFLRALPLDRQTLGSRLILGNSLFEMGDTIGAEAVLADASSLARNESDKLIATFARVMNLFWSAGRTEDALQVNEAARLQLADTGAQRMLLINEAAMLTVAGKPKQGLIAFEKLGEIPTSETEMTLWLYGAGMKPAALAVTGHTRAAVAAAEHAYNLHRSLEDRTLLLHPVGHLVSLVLALAEAGRLDDARTVAEEAWAMLGQVRNPLSSIWLAYHQAHTEHLAGHIETARRWYAEAASQSRAHHSSRGLPLMLAGLAACASQLGDLEVARAVQEEAAAYPAMGYRSGEERLGEAWIHATQGDAVGARSILAQAAEAARNDGYVTSEIFLLSERSRLGDARGAVARLGELARACDGAWPAAYLQFATALAADEPDSLLAASSTLGALGADLLAAEAAATAAAVYARRGNVRRAAAANQIVRHHDIHCQGARTILLPTVGSAVPKLTAREQEIARLATSNEASKDIAERLQLSVRTVDNHLNHVYGKLGVTTRRGLAEALKLYESHDQS